MIDSLELYSHGFCQQLPLVEGDAATHQQRHQVRFDGSEVTVYLFDLGRVVMLLWDQGRTLNEEIRSLSPKLDDLSHERRTSSPGASTRSRLESCFEVLWTPRAYGIESC